MLISELNRGGRISRNENRISIYQTQGEINTSSVFQRETKTSEREVLTEHAHKKADIANKQVARDVHTKSSNEPKNYQETR